MSPSKAPVRRSGSGTTKDRGTAAVIGASIGGLLAAGALADHFERVIVLDRDNLPAGAQNRKGVPQGAHAHGLAPRGGMVMERMFPGLMAELAADGAPTVNSFDEFLRWEHDAYQAPFDMLEEQGSDKDIPDPVLFTRALLDFHLRSRVAALPNVTVLSRRNVTGYTATPDNCRVTGVTLEPVPGTEDDMIAADLVVDASGRNSRAPAWIESLGYERPAEERIDISFGYTTRFYRRLPGDAGGVKIIALAPTPPHARRSAFLLAVEGDRWLVTLGGYLGLRAAQDEQGFLDFARRLPTPDIYNAIKDADPLSEAITYNYPSSLRRRYDRLRRLPDGLLVLGDAFSSTNPMYGHGMSSGALQVEALMAALADGYDDLPRRFYRRAAKAVRAPWRLSAGSDLAYDGVTGDGPRAARAFNWWAGKVQRAARRDPFASLATAAVYGLAAPPILLFHPKVVARTVRDALARHPRSAQPRHTGSTEPSRSLVEGES